MQEMACPGCELHIFSKISSGLLQVSDQNGRDKHLNDTLNFLRGGSDSFYSSGAIHRSNLEVNTNVYLNAIASIYRELRWHYSKYDDIGKVRPNDSFGGSSWRSSNLYTNNVRIEIDIPGI